MYDLIIFRRTAPNRHRALSTPVPASSTSVESRCLSWPTLPFLMVQFQKMRTILSARRPELCRKICSCSPARQTPNIIFRHFGEHFSSILGTFWGGTPLRDHFLRSKGAGGHPERLGVVFSMIFDGFWAPFWSLIGVDFHTLWCFCFLFFSVRFRRPFLIDFWSILESILEKFWWLFGDPLI